VGCSAQDRYIIRGGILGRERLRVLARAMAPTTSALLDRVALAPGMSCLDAGCGGGDVTRELARRVSPGGDVVGIDIDETKVDLAREEADDRAIGNVEYLVGDVLDTDLAPAYDAIYVRFLLTHLADPAAAVRRIATGLRAGGVLIVEDIDFTGAFCHPPSPAYDRYARVYTETARARGFDPYIGPRLPGLLAGAGLERVHVSVGQPVGIQGDGLEHDIKLVTPLTLENVADAAIAERLTTREELDDALDALYRLADDTKTLMAFPRIVQSWAYAPSPRR
jgi:SAM-dependent methyltransferase